jgi:hypothetical protein
VPFAAGVNRTPFRSLLSVDHLEATTMKQPHTEQSVQHTETQQNTGNHKKPGSPDEHGADRFGGTRTGKENVEKTPEKPSR